MPSADCKNKVVKLSQDDSRLGLGVDDTGEGFRSPLKVTSDATATLRLRSFSYGERTRTVLRSFPTRRSSDLARAAGIEARWLNPREYVDRDAYDEAIARILREHGVELDRKSTRLNSSHVEISYAVC